MSDVFFEQMSNEEKIEYVKELKNYAKKIGKWNMKKKKKYKKYKFITCPRCRKKVKINLFSCPLRIVHHCKPVFI